MSARIAILISGRGSNMTAILDAVDAGRIPGRCVLVVSNVPGAPGLDLARARGVPAAAIDHRESRSREEHDRRVVEALRDAGADLVCHAGYMRIVSSEYLRAFPGRILNVHPSLLPAFPGLHAQRQALEHGAKVSGATVHLVDESLDGGPIVLQAPVPVREDDTEESLSARILVEEHRIYPEAVALLAASRLVVEGRRVRILPPPEPAR